MFGVGREASAHGHRQPLGRLELEALVREGRAQSLDDRLELRDRGLRGDEQELVGAVPTHDDVLENLALQLARDRDEGRVAGREAVVVVEQWDIVDVDEGDPERRPSGPGLLERHGEIPHQRAVVHRAGQRVAPRGFDERYGLTRQPSLRGAKDQEQDRRRHEGGGQSQQDDVAADVIQSSEDRNSISPDPDDAEDFSIDGDRQELPKERRRGQDARSSLGLTGRGDRRLGSTSSRGREGAGGRHRRAPGARLTRRDDRAIGQPELDAQDLPDSWERRELGLQPGGVRRRERLRSGEVAGADVGVDEGASRGRVAADDVVERRG